MNTTETKQELIQVIQRIDDDKVLKEALAMLKRLAALHKKP